MKGSGTLCLILSCLSPALWAADAADEVPIPYRLTLPGQSAEYRHGAIAYEGLKRGTFDREVMDEILPQKIPKNLATPVVVPYKDRPNVIRTKEGERKIRLTGEDRIFKQIAIDVIKSRCILLGDCPEEKKPEMPPRIELPIRLR
ncbi:hypothetical protein [Marinobacterium jannaschii]|uniref:hypothetical protein n=1 Tax=Marinobacterium jannaschii TaxID=64970 RepID=UPI000489924B|nr:hypothetical protein [Marinobacterium jannaschii]